MYGCRGGRKREVVEINFVIWSENEKNSNFNSLFWDDLAATGGCGPGGLVKSPQHELINPMKDFSF